MSDIPVMTWTCHILDPRSERRPFCGAQAREGEALVTGGLNSSNCDDCIAAAAKEPDAPPKCAVCDFYHHDREAWFFHMEETPAAAGDAF